MGRVTLRGKLLLFLAAAGVMTGCAPKMPSLSPGKRDDAARAREESPGAPGAPQEKVDFFATVDRTRKDIASLLVLTETRVEATFAAAEDSSIQEEERTELASMSEEEKATFDDFLSALDAFLRLIPEGGTMDRNLTKGRMNAEVKYESYVKAVDAGIADQFLDALEKTAIESNVRSLSTELQFIESSLPLPLDSLKVGPTFVVEADSVDLFFEVVRDIEDMTGQLRELRARISEYQQAKAQMDAFRERERILAEEIEKSKRELESLQSALDTTRLKQEKAVSRLETRIRTEADSLGKVIRRTDEAIKTDISSLATGISDTIDAQRRASDSLFFKMNTNLDVVREEIDSLKGVVRFYDIAEKGLPELDEDVLNILKLPALRHKIILRNGTVVVGQILAEDLDRIVMQTTIGRLVIEKDFIARYEEKSFPGPRVEFEGDYRLVEYPDREEFTGVVRNIGRKRADFVKVTFFLWDSTTDPVGVGSSFVDGHPTRFATGVISDASIPPGETATYHVTVEKQPGKKVAYRTRDVKWRSYD